MKDQFQILTLSGYIHIEFSGLVSLRGFLLQKTNKCLYCHKNVYDLSKFTISVRGIDIMTVIPRYNVSLRVSLLSKGRIYFPVLS